MRVLICGLGSIGQRHARNLLSLGVRDLLAYRVRKRPVGGLEDRLEIFDDLDEALQRRPDAAIICSPTSLHVPTSLTCAEAGCSLYIEKPLSHSTDGVRRLADLVERRRLVCMIGCNYRFHPSGSRVRTILQEGAIGRVLYCRAEWGEFLPFWHPEEDYREGYSARLALGGGAILTLIHDLDLAYWFFGSPTEVTCVTAHSGLLELDVEDVAEILLRYPDGILCSIHVDYLRQPPVHRWDVLGTAGGIAWDRHALSMEVRSSSGVERLTETGFEKNQMYKEAMGHFINCVEKGERPLVPLEDGIRVLEIVLAAKRAARERRAIEL